MGTVYADRTAFFAHGLPAQARGKVTDAQIDSALATASAFMDSKFRGRYPLPFLTYGIEVVRACCTLAAEEVLTIRGWDANNAGDSEIMRRGDLTREWLDQVQRSAAHPDVTLQASQVASYQSPKVLTSSAIATNSSCTGTTRGL
jgi:phage gp36-like protein